MSFSPTSIRFESALTFAAQLHRSQTRKATGVPYISHLLAVTALVMENGADEDTAIAALLHDALEDQAASFRFNFNVAHSLQNHIRASFGSRVLSIVEELTETDEDPKPPWRQRKETYLAHLATASDEALLIALADKLHNATCTLHDLHRRGPDACWANFNAGRESQRWWYHALLAVFDRRVVNQQLLYELHSVVGDLFPDGSP